MRGQLISGIVVIGGVEKLAGTMRQSVGGGEDIKGRL